MIEPRLFELSDHKWRVQTDFKANDNTDFTVVLSKVFDNEYLLTDNADTLFGRSLQPDNILLERFGCQTNDEGEIFKSFKVTGNVDSQLNHAIAQFLQCLIIADYSTAINDSVVLRVVNKHCDRALMGHKKYNSTMDRDDLTQLEWLQHLQEEVMDVAVYCEKLMEVIGNEYKGN